MVRLFELEKYSPPDIEIGDDVMLGKFKNRKAKVTGFDTDKNNQPELKTTKGKTKLFKPRIQKLMKEENEKSTESLSRVMNYIFAGWNGYNTETCYVIVGRELRRLETELLADPKADVVIYKTPSIGYIHAAIVCSDHTRIEKTDPHYTKVISELESMEKNNSLKPGYEIERYPVSKIINWFKEQPQSKLS